MSKTILNKGLKETVNSQELSVSKDVYEQAEHSFHELVLKACARAKANGRKTLQGKDF